MACQILAPQPGIESPALEGSQPGKSPTDIFPMRKGRE